MDDPQGDISERDDLLKKLLQAIKSPNSNVSNEEIRKILSLTNPNDSKENETEGESNTSSDDSDAPSEENSSEEQQQQPISSSAISGIKNYPRRPGSDDLGREYEIKITALLSLRCAAMKDTKEMWLGSNVDEVGDFDDIVLFKQTPEDKHYAYMVQSKHQEKPKNITQHDLTFSAKNKTGKREKSKEDFSLAKYSKGFVSLMDKINNSDENELEIIRYLRKVDRIMFVLYTNKGVNECDFLEEFQDDVLSFLNTNHSKENIYKFNHNKLSYDPEFLQQLALFTDQIHLNDTDKLIRKEIKNYFSSSGITNIDFKGVTKKFITFIQVWAKGFEVTQKDSKNFYTLTKSDILNKLVDIVLDPYKLDFSKENYSFYDSPEKLIWNEIIRDKTITVVDFDEITFGFLKEYIGSEVKQYCNEYKKTWFDHLSKNTQKLFYKTFSESNTQIICSQEEITMFDIYQCLWSNNKVPLILKINNAQDYQNINKVLKLFINNFRIIITTNKTIELTTGKTKNSNHLFTLNDLSNEKKNKILNQSVKLQGRSSQILANLVEESKYKFVKCNDMINILAEEFSVGSEFKLPKPYFIERSLSKVFLEREVFKKLKDEIFFIENFDIPDELYDNVITSMKQIKKYKSQKKTIHRLVYYNEFFFEWIESFGSIKNIRQFQQQYLYNNKYKRDEKLDHPFYIKNLWIPLGEMINNKNLWSTTKIISANPGTGKSILMSLVARQAPIDLWVLKVNLNEHEEYYKNLKNSNYGATDHLKNFFEEILTLHGSDSENKDLTRAAFQKFLNNKKILILLDGFDEISIMYKDEVTRIAKCFHDEGYQMWITTRPSMNLHLEHVFDVFSIDLIPFTPADQKEYLKKYFTLVSEDFSDGNEILGKFVKELLQAAKVNLLDQDYKFMGVPLQTELLAEVFSEEYKNSLKAGIVKFNKRFDLLYLYGEFIRKKIDILCGKFGKDAERTRVLFEEHQQMFSLKTLFDKEYLSELNIEEKLDEYCKDKKHENEMQFLQREGVVVLNQSNSDVKFTFNVNFIHRTFAEYLAAKWLSENFNSEDEQIKRSVKILVGSRFKPLDMNVFLFRIYDRIVVRDSKSHLALINWHLEQINLSDLNTRDKSGRTLLHLMAIHGFQHPGSYYESNLGKIEDKIANIIEKIPNNQITGVKDDILGYNALDFALASNALAVANKLCEKSSELHLNIDISVVKKSRYFTYCVVLGYQSLFRVLVPYFSARDMLIWNMNKRIIIESYCRLVEEKCKNQNFYDYVDGFAVETISELFKFKYQNPETPFVDYYADLRFAASYGSINNVHFLVAQGFDVNQQDIDFNTPLHYATKRGRLEAIQILLAGGAEINKSGQDGDSALHIAARIGNNEIVEELLAQGAEINKFNYHHNTPIHFALKKGHLNTVKLLLLNGANTNAVSKDGDSLLHFAAREGSEDIIIEVLQRNPEALDKQNNYGKTPLHCASNAEQFGAVQVLLGNGANCNIQDKLGNSALHYAARRGDDHIVMELLSRNAEINLQNNDEETALLLASSSKHVDATKLLLSKGADPNTKDQKGNSPLRLAARDGCADIVSELIKAGADVNSVDLMNSTPLHMSTMARNTDVTKLLLANNADVNIRDMYNVTPLHYAASAGNDEILSELLSKGADINALTGYKNTPLHYALIYGKVETAKFLLSKGANWRTENTQCYTPLHHAAEIGFSDGISQFVTALDINKQTNNGHTALHLAAKKGHADTVRILLDNSANVNVQNMLGKTPLHVSLSDVVYNNIENYERLKCTVRLLLEKGADTNVKDEDGNTVLHCACKKKSRTFKPLPEDTENSFNLFYNDVVLLLLDNGADVNLKNGQDETPLDFAKEAGFTNLVSILQQNVKDEPPIVTETSDETPITKTKNKKKRK